MVNESARQPIMESTGLFGVPARDTRSEVADSRSTWDRVWWSAARRAGLRVATDELDTTCQNDTAGVFGVPALRANRTKLRR